MEVRGALQKDKWNYGASFSSQKLVPAFPVSFKAGNLSTSGSLSKLNSPALSSSLSAFAPLQIKSTKLGADLAYYNNFSSAQAFFLEAGLKKGPKLKELSLSAYYKPASQKGEASFSSCLNAKLNPWEKAEINYSFTGGFYPYKKANFSSWFTDKSYYKQGQLFCFNNQLSFSSKIFSSLFIMTTYQSPFNELLNSWRSENLLRLKDFSFTLDAFYNPNDFLITSSDKKLSPLLQFSSGGQYKFSAGNVRPCLITIGIKSQADIKLDQESHTLKTAGGIKYSEGFGAGSVISHIELDLLEQAYGIKASFSMGSIESSNSFYIRDFLPSISGKFTFTPDSKKAGWTFAEKIVFKLEYLAADRAISISNKNQFLFTQKNSDESNKMNFSTGLNAKVKIKYFTIQLCLDYELEKDFGA